MEPDRGADWERVRELFEAACERPPEEREPFVREAAGEDRATADEVLELLGAADDSRGRLAPPRASWREDGPVRGAPIGPGARVGPYTVERTIATGGMGVVFLARREEPRRTVALKMIQLGFDDDAAVRRFRTEVSVLAALTHPGIARVYESGVLEDGARSLPWFAMEVVPEARTLVEHARAASLSDAERVDLLREVLGAVEHGHAKGVVHRDLKPDNLLVDAEGRTKVIDFGVARATGADGSATATLTRTGTIVGTLQYMSPEQLAGSDRVDARTDVYALGVVLFELLCGAHPFDLADLSLAAAARRVAETSPRRPSALRKDVPRDLETIVLKALEKEPGRRYASAAAFARDLERWRLHEPVEARPPSMTYQARLFARRHRAFVGAALVISVVSVFAAAYSYRKSVVARDAEALANRRFSEGRRLARGLLEDAFDELLGVKGATRAKATLARVATSYLDGLAGEAERDLGLGLELARGYVRMGSILGAPRFSNLGDSEGAFESYGRAILLGERLREGFAGEAEVDLFLARAHLLRGRVAFASARHDRAVSDIRLGLAALGRVPRRAAEPDRLANLEASLLLLRGEVESRTVAKGAGEDDFLRALAVIEPYDQPNARRTAAMALERLGRSARSRGDVARAIELFERHVEVLESLVGTAPDEVEGRSDLHSALGTLGTAILPTGRHEEALRLFERSLALCEPIAAADEDDAAAWSDLGFSHEWMGSARRALGDLEEAAAAFERGAEIAERWRERDPGRTEWPWAVSRRRFGRALVLNWLGRSEEALADAERAFAAGREAARLAPDDVAGKQDLCWGAGAQFQILHGLGRFDEAIAVAAEARDVAARQLEVDPDDAVMARHVVVLDDQVGIAWQSIADDVERPAEERRAAYDEAIAAYERTRGALRRLVDREQQLPGDEGVFPVLEESIERCRVGRAALRGEGGG
ncbi:MAG: protein kinase [Planctomycetota bacterium JB042]